MWKLIVLALATAAPQVEVTPLAGPPVQGDLVELSSQDVVLESSGQTHRWDTSELQSISRVPEPPAAEITPAVVVEWLDGSRIQARGYAAQAGIASVNYAGPQLESRTDIIRYVRFPAADTMAQIDKQWQDIVASQHAADVLVIRRSPSTLDMLEGVIYDVNEQVVEFEFDGQRIPVPRSKIEGFMYYHVAGRKLPDPLCQLREVDGTRWSVASLAWNGLAAAEVGIATAAGPEVLVPWERIQSFDFSSGNILYLSDIDPEQAQFAEFPQWRLPQLAGVQQMFSFQRDRSLSGGRMQTGGQTCRKGLALHSRAELVYRVPEGYGQFRAVAGIDDEVRVSGHVILVISGDDRELFRQAISGGQDPVELNLDISGVRRLKILVDFGEEQDIADRLHLCEARITK